MQHSSEKTRRGKRVELKSDNNERAHTSINGLNGGVLFVKVDDGGGGGVGTTTALGCFARSAACSFIFRRRDRAPPRGSKVFPFDGDQNNAALFFCIDMFRVYNLGCHNM